jgi:hypothetical protein
MDEVEGKVSSQLQTDPFIDISKFLNSKFCTAETKPKSAAATTAATPNASNASRRPTCASKK